jgi:hypothetical protein
MSLRSEAEAAATVNDDTALTATTTPATTTVPPATCTVMLGVDWAVTPHPEITPVC